MDSVRYVALTADGTPAFYGYARGVGHIVRSDVLVSGGDHVGGAAAVMLTVCPGAPLDPSRVVERFPGDRLCKRCVAWSVSPLGVADVEGTRAASVRELADGSVADVLLADPAAVVITLDDALSGVSGDRAARDHAEAVRGAREKRVAKRAKGEAQPDPVRCVRDAPAEDVGGGKGECRSCGWRGPLKATVAMRDAEDVVACACACQHKKTHGPRAKCLHRDRCVHKTVTTMVMTSHWRGGRAPVQVTMSEDLSDQSLAVSPATVDTGNRSADDMIGGNAAGSLPGRTSLTRGRPLDADVVTGPSERRTHKVTGESLPSSTTLDGPLGRPRIDARSVYREIAGEEYGYLTPEEVGMLGKTGRRRYWRHVATNRDRAERARKLVAAREARLRAAGERDAARRLADVLTAS